MREWYCYISTVHVDVKYSNSNSNSNSKEFYSEITVTCEWQQLITILFCGL
jgi:hypothetical protein